MRRYRLTENRLRNIIREAIKEQFGRTKDNDWDGWEDDEEKQERKSWVPGARLGDLPSNHPERQRYNNWAKMAHRPKTNESKIRGMIREAISDILLVESFKSDKLKQWFMKHGGVKKTYAADGYPNQNVKQDGLSDVTDRDISHMREFPNLKAVEKEPYANATLYQANDGACLYVYFRKGFDCTNPTWGGNMTKKGAERFWRDYHDRGDGKDVYHYSHKNAPGGNNWGRRGLMGDFGIYTSNDYQNHKKHNQQIKNSMTPEEWNTYINREIDSKNDYLKRNFNREFNGRKK